MKTKVKSHVQQARNMAGTAKKFPPAPPTAKRSTPYVPQLPNPETGENPFGKQLASGVKEVRDATFVALGKWLGLRVAVDLLDMKKIWKGLFYAMWHADGWDVQEELAEQMSGLMHKLKHKVVMSYVGVFYITARREWVGIDRHRMDKYLLLARRMTSHVLRYCADRNWAEGAVRDVSEMISRTALGTGGSDGEKGTVDVGLKLHVAEIFVPELRRVAAGRDAVDVGCDPDKENEANGGAPRTVFKKKRKKGEHLAKQTPRPGPSAATSLLLEPFAKLLQIDRHAPLHRRVLEEVFDAILEGVEGGFAEKALEKGDMDDPAELQELAAAMMIRLDGVTMRRMSRRFIELGAAEGAEDLNRESLYKLHTSFRKSAKRAEKNAERDSGAGGGLVVTKKLKKNAQEPDPALEPDKEGMEESSEEDPEDDSFHTAPDASMVEDIEEGGTSKENEDLDEEEDEEAQRSHGRTVDGVRESEEELDEEDDFEEADEFDEELHIADREEVDKEDEDEDEEDSLDDSDQDNSEDETSDDGSPSQSSEEEELDEDAEMARSEAAVAAANAAAERKALRKAERWAAAVGATPPPKKANGASYLARRAVVGVSPGPPASPSSPSKRVAWNLKRNTRHTPSGPPNPVKGEGLKALLSSTPRKSLLRPIHAAPHMAPHSDPRGRKSSGRSPGSGKKETMTPGRRRGKASGFF